MTLGPNIASLPAVSGVQTAFATDSKWRVSESGGLGPEVGTGSRSKGSCLTLLTCINAAHHSAL